MKKILKSNSGLPLDGATKFKSFHSLQRFEWFECSSDFRFLLYFSYSPPFLFVCLLDVWKASKSLVQKIKNKNNIAVCTSMSMSLMLCEMKGALEESLLREKLEFKSISKLKKNSSQKQS